jgi:beta-glucuronidase
MRYKKLISWFIFFFFLSLFTYRPLFSQIASLEATVSIREVDGIIIPYSNGFPMPSFEKQNRSILNLKGEWKKQRFNADHNISLARRDAAGYSALINEAADRQLPSYNDAAWDSKTLPGVENELYPYPLVPEYYENGVFYRKTFTVDSSQTNSFAKLMFYSVNYVADVWLNGVYLGWHEGGYTPFAFDVSSALVYGKENKLVVRVDSPPWGTRNDIVPYVKCDWFNYEGIIHDVYLEFSNKVNVNRVNVIPQSTAGDIQTTIVLDNHASANQNVDVSVDVFKANVNETNIRSERASGLIGAQAAVIGTTAQNINILADSVKVWRTNLTVKNPALWSPKSPDLYIMKVTLKQNGSVIDEYYTQFGIRTVKTNVDKVNLNNNPVFLTGVARHEDHPLYGRSIPVDTIYNDLLKVKSLNALSLRTAHYPNHLQTYLLADRLGIAIIEEIPVWWFDDVMPWVIQNSARHIHEQMFREMVFKDYNRPSVFMWSTCNECLNVPYRKAYITKVHQDLDFNYPDGRLVTESAAADRPGPNDDSQSACDVAGWTMYFGIFHGGTYYDTTRYFLGKANLAYPEKPIYDSEFGYWSAENNSIAGQNNQVKVFDSTFAAFTFRASVLRNDGSYRDGGYLMGVTWWCIFDWHSSQHPQGYQSMGLIKMPRDSVKLAGHRLKNGYAPFYNVGGVATDVKDDQSFLPTGFTLGQNFPNPFNPETRILYQIPKSGLVKITLYDLLGREIAKVVDNHQTAGMHQVFVNMNQYRLASGVYYYRLEADGFSDAKKMVYLK